MIVSSLAILGFCTYSGLFFIKSIVRPVRDVSNIARKIAMGDFESRIEITKNDEIGELCDTINYMAAELSQAENLKNDFISSVSHELRTPLTAIRGWGETAKMSIGTDEELVKRGLDVVLSEADRLSGLVEELLDFSRMQTGRLTVVSQPFNISSLLEESVSMYAELSKKQGIELIFTPPAEEIEVMGDMNRIKQVFINIIDNAVKYTESGGQVLINQIKEEACVRIEVSDTGVGIPAQDLDRVKEKFYKANKTVRGSGIGLAVADEIIKQHKGLLFIESTEGVGTKATIVLPIFEPEEIENE
jgi:signal transduction histidine kinase